jgi:hypothetical protein
MASEERERERDTAAASSSLKCGIHVSGKA